MQIEHKTLPLEGLSLKFDNVAGMAFSGYASKFGGVDSYNDTIAPGAYARTLKNRDRPIRMRWNHYGNIIGKWMSVEEDDVGLFVQGELTPGHSVAENVYASLKHGAIDGMSIGYYLNDFDVKPDGIRVLKDIELIEISVVEEPADLGATITDLKAAVDAVASLKELEALLRDAGGFSRAQATAIVAKAKALGAPRDADVPDRAKAQALAAMLALQSL
jgi:hypothetical protein